MDIACPALAMLHQGTEYLEVHSTSPIPRGALIYLVVVGRAVKVLIEPGQRLKLLAAQYALVRPTVVRPLGRVRLHNERPGDVALGTAEQTARVGYDSALVHLHGDAIDHRSVHARRACSRFEVLSQICVGSKGLATPLARAIASPESQRARMFLAGVVVYTLLRSEDLNMMYHHT